jgi:transglycosylase-like protein
VVLSGDGGTLTFDMEGGTRGLSVHQARIAHDVVRGIDAHVRARGTLSAEGDLRLDDFAAALGALDVAASGTLSQGPANLSAAMHFEIPTTSCQAMLDSMPSALLPVLAGTKMAGTFGALGRIAFDTRKLDDLELQYDVQDHCRVVDAPEALARERFKKPFTHRVYLPDGTMGEQTTGPGTSNWTPLGAISPYLQVAVLTTEDGGFPRHHGFNQGAIRASLVTNLKERRFVRGASTISMQLAKNLFLSREKTLSRKLEELVLTDYLEQTFSKDELMELYLNVIEFGPNVYGVTAASDYYFGRRPAELNLAESFFLSSLLPAPLRYGSMRSAPQAPDGWMNTLHSYMRTAKKVGLISEPELTEGTAEQVVFWHGDARPAPRPPVIVRPRESASPDAIDPPSGDDSADAP